MKAKIKGFRQEKNMVTIEVTTPNTVTSSKHVKLLEGMKVFIDSITSWDGSIITSHEDTPFGIAYIFLEIIQASDGIGTKSYILAESLTKFPVSDFIQFGDTNHLKDVSKAWFSDYGTHIDVQVEIIKELHGRQFTTDDIIEHVSMYKPGQYMQPLEQELEAIRQRFLEMYGFKLTISYAEFLCNLGVKKRDEDAGLELPF